MTYLFKLVGIPFVGLFFLSVGCAHAPIGTGEKPRDLFGVACQQEQKVESVKGSVWMKAKSKEASGQFPAAVFAQAPSELQLEVTNPLGGTEAVITIKDQHYKIEIPNKKDRTETGFGSWGGIPLHWAADLFLGRVPCPSQTDLSSLKLSLNPENELVVDSPASLGGSAERFIYRFRSWGGKPWPEALRWERMGAFAAVVDFKFEDPDSSTGVPKKWEAKSVQGEVKVRWREREASSR